MDYVIKTGRSAWKGNISGLTSPSGRERSRLWERLSTMAMKQSSTPMASMSALAASMLIPIWPCSNRRSIAPVMTFTAAALRRPAAARRPSWTIWPLGGRLFPALSFEQYKNWRHPVRSTIASMASSSMSMIRSCENWASSSTKVFPASRPIRRMVILSVKEN